MYICTHCKEKIRDFQCIIGAVPFYISTGVVKTAGEKDHEMVFHADCFKKIAGKKYYNLMNIDELKKRILYIEQTA